MKAAGWELDPAKFLSRRDANRLQATAAQQAECKRKKSIRDSFIVLLGLATGLRVMEIAALKCGDTSFASGPKRQRQKEAESIL